VPTLASDLAHVPSTLHAPSSSSPVSSRPSLVRRLGVCAHILPEASTAVVNSIYVPAPRAPSSTVSRQVSAIYVRRPFPPPRTTLDPRASSFQPRAIQSDSTSAPRSGPTHTVVSSSTDLLPDSSLQQALQPTTFTPSSCATAPYTYHEAEEPVPPDITRLAPTEPVANVAVMSTSVDTPTADSLEVPSHLQELFDETVERSNLSLADQQYLAEVLRRNSSAFATGPMDIGFCDIAQHDIDTGDAKPIKQPPRRPALAARQEEDQQLDEMLAAGIIEPSFSPWSSPVCMVRKRDDTFRFCIDYRRLNNVTEKDAFPVPHVKDTLDSFHGARYFATIDLLSGYWQIGMTESEAVFRVLYQKGFVPVYGDALWPHQRAVYVLSSHGNYPV